ncbi:hypothetical protein pb186bvf_013720 [Paramecium bursaria]
MQTTTRNDFRVKKIPIRQLNSTSHLRKKLSPLKVNKFNVYQDCLNDLTQQKFDHCKSRITFQQVESAIRKNTLLCILFIQNVQVFSKYDLPNSKVPPKFSWEAKYRDKTLQLTTPYAYGKSCHGIIDFMFKSNAKHPLILKLWKVKNYEEHYIGEIELNANDFVDFEVVMDYHHKIIKETFVQKEMFKVYNEQSAPIGQVSLKIIQFCSSSVPTNKMSNIPGSPKTQDMRKKHLQIEEYKSKGIEWGNSKDEEYIIQLINEAIKETVTKITLTIDQVKVMLEEFDGKMSIIIEIYSTDNVLEQRTKIQLLKRIKKENQERLLSLLSTDAKSIEQLNQLRNINLKGRIKRQDLEQALQILGATPNQLFFYVRDDLNICLFDMLLDGDSLGEIVLYFNQIDLKDDLTAEQFAQSLFDNIRKRLRTNHYLKALATFISALSQYPGIALIIQQFAYTEENNWKGFLSEFDFNNYQHIIVLSKLRKLCKKYLNENNPFALEFDILYKGAKIDTYFKIPVLPKKLNLEQKRQYLTLEHLGSNIFHEIVRRKRWNYFFRNKDCEMIYEVDSNGTSAMMEFLQNAPLDLILQFDTIKDQVAKDGKSSIHFLLMNPDQSLSTLLQCLEKFNFNLHNVWNDFNPLSLFLERLIYKQRKHKSRIIKEFKAALDKNKSIQIIDILSQNSIHFCKQFDFNKYLLYSQNIQSKEFKPTIQLGKPFKFQKQYDQQIHSWLQLYQKHTKPAQMLCRLDDSILELIWPQFQWINWLCPNVNYPIDRVNGQSLLNNALRCNQNQLISQYLQKEVNIEYKSHDYHENEKFNMNLVFQSLLLEEGISSKLKEEIVKKYKQEKEQSEEPMKKSKFIMKQIKKQRFQVGYDFIQEQMDVQERSTNFVFKYNYMIPELLQAKNLSFAKMFRRAYDFKILHGQKNQYFNFIDILISALYQQNQINIHLALYFATLRQQNLIRSCNVKYQYLLCLKTHWAVELEFQQFLEMYNDVKDLMTQNEVNNIVYILAINGRHQKLKLLIDRMTNQNFLVQSIPIAAHQMLQKKDSYYYIRLKELFVELDIKKLYFEDSTEFSKPPKQLPKVEPKKPFDKTKSVFCKWQTLAGTIQATLLQIYKQGQNSNQRIKSEQQIINKQYALLWFQDYQYKLKRLFTRQNIKSIFYQAKQRESDFSKTVDLLLDKLIQQKLAPQDEFFYYVHVNERFQDLLQNASNQSFCIVQALDSMISLFKQEQSNDILQRCINFIKKYINSKIYKDISEYKSDLPKLYLIRGDITLSSCRFATELVLILDQNFTTQEFENIILNIVAVHDKVAQYLLALKSQDKRVAAFVQKYFQTDRRFCLSPHMVDHVISIYKAGAQNLLPENAFEQFLDQGQYYYLKSYFFNILKPKGMLNDDQKKEILKHAINGSSAECIQMCIEELCGPKNSDLKSIILDGQLFSRAMAIGCESVLIYFVRKIMKQMIFSQKDILRLLNINDNVLEQTQLKNYKIVKKASKYQERVAHNQNNQDFVYIQNIQTKQNQFPFTAIFFKNCQVFYKEFFVDYLQKILSGEYKVLMGKILNTPIADTQQTLGFMMLCTLLFKIKQMLISVSSRSQKLTTCQLNYYSKRHQQLENMLKLEQNKYPQKYHFTKCGSGNTNMKMLCQLETSLFLAPLMIKSGLSLSNNNVNTILELILNHPIDPDQKPLLFLIRFHLEGQDKEQSMQVIESFCDKHPAVMHDKFYNQIFKNREAFELLQQFYVKGQQISLDLEIRGCDNVVNDFLLISDPMKYSNLISKNQQVIFCLRVIYDRSEDLEGFFTKLQDKGHQIIAALCILLINPNKYAKFLFEKLCTEKGPFITQIFKEILKYHGGIYGIYFFLVHLIQGLYNNQIYHQLIQVKPIGDLNIPINQEKEFLEQVKESFQTPDFILQDNTWSQIIQQSTKATHSLYLDKWFHGICLLKSLANVCYEALTVIHEIRELSKQDDYIKYDFWDIQTTKMEIKTELFSADQVAQHKTMISKMNGIWKIKYPLGMVKDTQFIYPSVFTSQRGTEYAKNTIIQSQFESLKQKLIPKISNFQFEGVNCDNVQQLISQQYEITEHKVIQIEEQVIYNGKVLNNSYLNKKKGKREFLYLTSTKNILVQVVSKEEYYKRDKAQHIFAQIMDDNPQKTWSYYIDHDLINVIKEDLLIQEIQNMIQDRLPQGCNIHLQSFIECYFMKVATQVEKLQKKYITGKTCVDLCLQWDLLMKVIKNIRQQLQFVPNVWFEMQEVDQKKVYPYRQDGFDGAFRLGFTELYVHNQNVIARLSIAQVGQLNFKTQGEGIPVLQYIFNEQSMRVKKVIGSYHYFPSDLIGQGYSSNVYKGYKDQQVVAIKVINLQRLTSPISRSLLQSEIAVLKKIDSPYLLKVNDIFETQNNTYIITEYCEQGDLADIVENQILTETRALEILDQILKGMKELQKQRILHRDIKPANILISKNICKLADFGFAIDDVGVDSSNVRKFSVGTPLYMAPETLIYNTYSEKSDIWAIGVVLYYMLHQRHPYQGNTDQDLIQLFFTTKPTIKKGLLPQTEQALTAMLQVDPKYRCSLDQLLDLLPRKRKLLSINSIPQNLVAIMTKRKEAATPQSTRHSLEERSKTQRDPELDKSTDTNQRSTDTSNESQLHNEPLPVTIRPSYKFCQFLDTLIPNVEDDKIVLLLMQLQAIKANYISNNYPPSFINLNLKKWINLYKAKCSQLEIDALCETFTEQFGQNLLQNLQDSQGKLLVVRDVIQDTLNQGCQPILFARRWENQQK